MRKIGFISLALAAALLPSTMFAGRLDNNFSTREADAADDINEACIEVSGDDFSADGEVTGTSGGCTVEIFYRAPLANKASSSALKGDKTQGSAKVSQSIFSRLEIDVFDTDGLGVGVCAEEFFGSVQENVEKCKVSASMKGTSVEDDPLTEPFEDDTVESSRVTASCDLGLAGANVENLDTIADDAPTQEQIDVVVDAFATRDDVKIDNKGKLSIKHNGVPDTGLNQFCND